MNIYHYDPITKEYMGTTDARVDPLETIKAGRDVFLLPAHATIAAPPPIAENEAAVWTGASWDAVADHRGKEYWDPDTGEKATVTALGASIPEGCPTQAPPAGMFIPQWTGAEWIESAVVFQGEKVETKADVDRITRRRISELGEEKAKTEKLLAGSGSCSSWDEFISARAAVRQEGDAFVLEHSLT